MATLQEITSEDAFNSFMQSAPPTSLVVLYFNAPWAAPCTQMKSILTALASTYPSNESISFLSINAEDLSEISENYDVTAVPFLVLQRGGETLETVSGSDATKVRSAVERHAGVSGAGKTGIPPPLQATPQTNGTSQPPPQTAPADSSAEPDKEELHARLAKLVKAAPVCDTVLLWCPLLMVDQVMLFMKGTPSAPQCGFSRQLVGLLRENQVKYGILWHSATRCHLADSRRLLQHSCR
jgi:thioredoxin-like negative regulator of GroEL